MTQAQALKEARRRWGARAVIEDNKKSHVLKSGAVISGPCNVGKIECGFFHVKGSGSSWEHAFAQSTWSDIRYYSGKRL